MNNILPFSSVGYEIDLPKTAAEFTQALEDLRDSGWVDRKTRAVFVELTVYNMPTHLYSSVTALFEFSPTGQILPMVDVDSARLYRCVSDMSKR